MQRLLLLLMLVLPTTLVAQDMATDEPLAADTVAVADSTAAVPIRFGYLSYDSVLCSLPRYDEVEQQMQQLRQAYETELRRVEDEFNQKYEAFLEGQKDFPRTILLKRQNELQDMLQRNVDFKRQGLRQLEQSRRDALVPLRSQIDQAISVVARTMRLALVINTDANACPFIEPSMGVDITDHVKQLLSE